LVGKEITDAAMVTIKIVGEVGAVKAALDAGSAALRVSRQNHYNSAGRAMQFITERSTLNPIPLNGIVEVIDGGTIRAIYDDPSPLNTGGPAPVDAVSVSKVECSPLLGDVLLNTSAPASGEPLRRTNVVGGCDNGRVIGGRGDLNLDAGEFIIYQVGFANQNYAEISNLVAKLECTQNGDPNAAACGFISIVDNTAELGSIPPGREGIASWSLFVDAGVAGLATADRFVDFRVTFESRATDLPCRRSNLPSGKRCRPIRRSCTTTRTSRSAASRQPIATAMG
jgi:hypothetical protein